MTAQAQTETRLVEIGQDIAWLEKQADETIRRLANAGDAELNEVAAIGSRLLGAVMQARRPNG